jgi:hypothetical protein
LCRYIATLAGNRGGLRARTACSNP